MNIKDKVDHTINLFTKKTGTYNHPVKEVTDSVKNGLVKNIKEIGKPLCPCRFYPDKKEECKRKKWVCPCMDMLKYKYCHCLLYVNEDGLPITEYLPEDHEGRKTYGLVKDPSPEKGVILKKS